MNKTKLLLALAGVTLSTSLFAQMSLSPMQEKVKLAMKMPERTQMDTERDRNRRPMRALEFFGLKEDMKVIEFAPGNGWYTKILAPVLAEKGELHLVSGQQWLNGLDKFLTKEGYNKTKKLPIDIGWNREEGRYALNQDSFGIKNVDMVLNIREYHNFNLADKAKLNKAAFDALKSGGSYVIVDHSRRPMSPETDEMRRREDPVKVILEVQQAGFELASSSDMFYRPDDQMIYEVGRKTVRGNTDRFSLVFKKP